MGHVLLVPRLGSQSNDNKLEKGSADQFNLKDGSHIFIISPTSKGYVLVEIRVLGRR